MKKLPEAHHLLPLLGIIALEDPLVREQVTALGTHGHLVCKFNFLRRDLSARWMMENQEPVDLRYQKFKQAKP